MNQPGPFFSVIVPTYNQARYLGQALDTLLAQTDNDWEAVVVNDGSTDSTADDLAAWCARDVRIRVFHKINGGVASALNVGISHARGSWICWLSSDDLFVPTKLAIHRRWIEAHSQARFFYSLPRILNDATGEITDPKARHRIPERRWQVVEQLRRNLVSANSICVETKTIRDIGDFDESLHYGQDYDMWLRLMARHPAVPIPERTCIVREHGDQDSRTFNEACFFDTAKSTIRFLNRAAFPEWFPEDDLSCPPVAHEAFRRALYVASNERAVVYRFGAHPAMVNRMLEWLSGDAPHEIRRSLQRVIRQRAARISRRLVGTPFGLMWKAIAVATSAGNDPFTYQPVDHLDVASNLAWSLRTGCIRGNAEQLGRYLERFEGLRSDHAPVPGSDRGQEALIECGTTGAPLRRAVEIGRRLQSRGWQVLLSGLTSSPVQLIEGVFATSALTSEQWRRGLLTLSPFGLRLPARVVMEDPGTEEMKDAVPSAASSCGDLWPDYRTTRDVPDHLRRMLVSALRAWDVVDHRIWRWRDRRQRRRSAIRIDPAERSL